MDNSGIVFIFPLIEGGGGVLSALYSAGSLIYLCIPIMKQL